MVLELLLTVAWIEDAKSWGFFAHQQINKMAVFCLPVEMFGFYKANIEYLSTHAVDPDKRRYLVPGEDVKHYIDIDHYERALPFDTLPSKYQDAMAKFSKDTVLSYGIVPWNIQWVLNKLSDAFAKHEVDKVLKLSAELGHYVGDAHVPLHSTENYNGQLTGQHGIHGFFESRLPELFFDSYTFFVGKASYLNNPLQSAWSAVSGSYYYVPLVFAAEKMVQKTTPENQKYAYEQKNNIPTKVYSRKMASAYHAQLNGLVEQRMQASVLAVASFWYTAWVDAGQPDISNWRVNITPVFREDSLDLSIEKKGLGREE